MNKPTPQPRNRRSSDKYETLAGQSNSWGLVHFDTRDLTVSWSVICPFIVSPRPRDLLISVRPPASFHSSPPSPAFFVRIRCPSCIWVRLTRLKCLLGNLLLCRPRLVWTEPALSSREDKRWDRWQGGKDRRRARAAVAACRLKTGSALGSSTWRSPDAGLLLASLPDWKGPVLINCLSCRVYVLWTSSSITQNHFARPKRIFMGFLKKF